jgi:AAA domain-containing protein/primase-like protein
VPATKQFLKSVPKRLRRLRWVGHDPDKRPVNPRTGELASTTDPTTCGTLSEALEWLDAHPSPGNGVGVVLDGSVIGVDFDHILDADGQLIYPELKPYLDALRGHTYVEVSPSRTGYHAFVDGSLPENLRHLRKLADDAKVEIWDSGRYLTWTGNTVGQPQVSDMNGSLSPFLDYIGRREAPASPGVEGEARISDVASALDTLDPDMGYSEWLDIGMALQAGLGQAGFSMWDVWSAGGKKYVPGECAAKWSTFHGQGRSLGTIFYRARQGGWVPDPLRAEDPKTVFKRETPKAVLDSSDTFGEDKWLKPVGWVIEPYLPRGELVELHGPHSTFKSTVALWMVLNVAAGETFCGHPVAQGKAAFISMEDGKVVLAHRRNAWIVRDGLCEEGKEDSGRAEKLRDTFSGLGREKARELALVHMEYGQPKERDEAVKWLIEALSGYSLVVFETSARLAEGPEDNPTMARLAFALEHIASKTGACVVLIRHVPKEVARNGALDSYGGRGGSALADAARGVLSVMREEGDALAPVRVVHTKPHALGPRGPDLVLKPEVGPAGLYLKPLDAAGQVNESERAVYDLLKDAGVEGTTWEAIRVTVRSGKGQRERRAILRQALDALVSKERARFVPNPKGGQGGRYYACE